MYIRHDADYYPYTFTDYLLLPEGAPIQLIGGELVREPSPTVYHQQISGTLVYKLTHHVREHGLGIVFAAPIDVYFDIFDAFQPDIVFIASERRGIIGSKFIEGPPDMVMEILSPSTASKDLTHKMVVYERSGVREYWIVDPINRTVDIYLNVGGTFTRSMQATSEGVVRSIVVEGFTIDAATIFNGL